MSSRLAPFLVLRKANNIVLLVCAPGCTDSERPESNGMYDQRLAMGVSSGLPLCALLGAKAQPNAHDNRENAMLIMGLVTMHHVSRFIVVAR
ncbi:hypothetical protein BD779DRAFT_1521820 [Infundibulicybe gibba]|nr:hypothetical protein BD779DRAFT_1521820 [Infundibulicybe gibba]